jgi:hypothetical protein
VTRRSQSTRNKLLPSTVAALSVLLVAIALTWGDAAPAPAPIEPSPSPSPEVGGGVLEARTLADLPATVRPYPFTEPAPAQVPTEIDGTYMLILTLDDLGGPSHALPFPCVRCSPYARDPGVTTLIFFEGEYFVHHQMSGFHANGHYTVSGDRLSLVNDANCSNVRGTYRWRLHGDSLRLEALDDSCAFEGERARDLATEVWSRIPVCLREVAHLWPGILGC